jgi:hypothetical protein
MQRGLDRRGVASAARALAAVALAVLASCQHMVIVRDEGGSPIERAEVVPSCPSFDFPAVMTDSAGRAALDFRYTPDARWLCVRKSGYETLTVNPYPRSWPAIVTLHAARQ